MTGINYPISDPTRTVGQDQLNNFREAMSSAIKNPYTVLLKPGKIPFGLLSESEKPNRVKILETESYQDAFGIYFPFFLLLHY